MPPLLLSCALYSHVYLRQKVTLKQTVLLMSFSVLHVIILVHTVDQDRDSETLVLFMCQCVNSSGKSWFLSLNVKVLWCRGYSWLWTMETLYLGSAPLLQAHRKWEQLSRPLTLFSLPLALLSELEFKCLFCVLVKAQISFVFPLSSTSISLRLSYPNMEDLKRRILKMVSNCNKPKVRTLKFKSKM